MFHDRTIYFCRKNHFGQRGKFNYQKFTFFIPKLNQIVSLKSIFCCLILLFSTGCCALLYAQAYPRVRNFNPSEYNAQAQNWSISQSNRAGWMYFANNAGLLELDGARWQSFYLPEKQTLRAVAFGKDERIYGGGFAEFGYWEKDRQGDFKYQSLSQHVQAEHLLKEEIWHILALPDQVLFQSFSTIYRYDYQGIKVINPPGAIMFLQALGSRLLLQVIGRGVFELMPDGTFKLLPGTASLSDKIVQFIVSDGANGFLIGTTNDGMWTYDGSKVAPWPNPVNRDFKRYQLNKALRMQDGRLAVGTILNGLYLLEADGRLRYHLNRETGLQNNTVLALNEDRDHNLWLGLDRGIDFVEINSPLTYYNDQTGKIGAVYTAAQFQNSLYVGTNQGVFIKNEGSPATAFQLIEGTQGQVWQLQTFDNQLICGHNSGSFVIRGTQARKISDITGGWCTLPAPSHPDALIQCTYTGLIALKKGTDGIWTFSHRIEGFKEPLRKIAFDQQGYLWGTHPNRGVYRLKLSDDLKQVSEQKIYTPADGLPSDFKTDLLLLDTQLIVNPESAPRAVRFQQGKVQFEALPNEFHADKLLAGRGSDYFKLFKSRIVLHASSNEYWFPISLVDGYENILGLNEHTYLFCQENGYAILDKGKLSPGQKFYSAKPVVRALEAGDVWMELDSNRCKMPIPYRDNDVRLRFAAPIFGYPPKFSWKLEGFSNVWSEWQNAPEKEFTNLPPGDYIFWLRTELSDQENPFYFTIKPPWYSSIWAWVVYILLATGLLILLEKINLRRLAAQRNQLESEKQRDLSQQRTTAEREMLSLELENKSRELSNAALGLIRKNEILLKIKDDLIASKGESRALEKLSRLIDSHVESDHDWEIFEASFNQVHDDFFKRLMLEYPDLTPGDLRLAAYLKMNLASKEIAPLLNISVRGVENKRYRLRKKIGLPEEANLTEFMMNY
jgi:ligand-binding sensor domain-containing protein/DNA-binding CsgD family transcriptional regulator